MNDYEIIMRAWRSRLLFRTDEEYRQALGVSLETVTANRAKEEEMKDCRLRLERQAELPGDITVGQLVRIYSEASEFYHAIDWGDRGHMVSRRKFCRRMFRLAATHGMRIPEREDCCYGTRSADARLLRKFFPDGEREEPAVEIAFILLFAFGVMKPWKADMRGGDLDDSHTLQSLRKFRKLIAQLREDIPRLGSTEKPMAFDEVLSLTDCYLNGSSLDHIPPCQTAVNLMRLISLCRALVVPRELRKEGESLQGLYMHGIWIDDADRGATRFWIFPDNILWAFCYCREGVGWKLRPYEFKVRLSDSLEYPDTFVIASPEGNIGYLLHDRGLDSHTGTGVMEMEYDEESGEVNEVRFLTEPGIYPAWLDWRKWERLGEEDSRRREFSAALRRIYDRSDPQSVVFENEGRLLTDNIDNLVGRDRKYLYVHDYSPRRYRLREKRGERFEYEVAEEWDFDCPLFELPLSEEHPLYAFPVEPRKRRDVSAATAMLAEILRDSDNISMVEVIRAEGLRYPRVLFPDYGKVFDLDMEELGKIGVRKFTAWPGKEREPAQ